MTNTTQPDESIRFRCTFALMLSAILLCCGCESSGSGAAPTDGAVDAAPGDGLGRVGLGALLVSVTDKAGQPVAGAEVIADPGSLLRTTDDLGSAFFDALEPGFYAITARHPTRGTGRTTVTVKSDIIAELIVSFSTGTGGPTGGAGGAAGGSGGNSGGTGGTGTGGTGMGGTGGTTTGGTGGTAMGGTGGTQGAPAAVTLQPIAKDNAGFTLTWSKSNETRSFSYRVHRAMGNGSFTIVDTVNDPAATTFRDTMLAFGKTYRYKIGVRLTGQTTETLSNEVSATAGGAVIEIESQVEAMVADPVRPYLYALDRVNNELHFVNLDTLKVEKSIFVGSSPVDMAMNASGTELFVANFGSTQIAVVDLDSRQKVRDITVDTSQGTWDGNPYRLDVIGNDYVVFTSEDQWCDLKLVSATNGAHKHAAGSIYQPDVVAHPDGTRIYIGQSGISSGNVIRYNIVNEQLVMADSSVSVGGFGARGIVMSTDGKYIFYAGRKYLADNLKSVLGTFTEAVTAVNRDGTVVIGTENIFNGETFAIIRSLPLKPSRVALDPDQTTLYLYEEISSKIFLYDISEL